MSKERTSPPRATSLAVRAIRTKQGDNIDVFAFFLRGPDIMRVADITRVERDTSSVLKGFQRGEIKTHVKGIVDFLDAGAVLFPNAIILAVSPEVSFKMSRGPAPDGATELAHAGILHIPVRSEGRRAAWIVDGQQRSLALSKTKNKDLPVPVIAFVTNDLATQREQFILVNKARPLPSRLINELLPEVSVVLPRDLATRKLPAELCNTLNVDPQSPFHKLVRRESDRADASSVIVDSALIEAIKRNLRPPFGALSPFRAGADEDPQNAYRILVHYWSEVKRAFTRAWGLDPTRSRLMHSAGIRVMGALMDPIMLRAESTHNVAGEVRDSLHRIASHCAWTEGAWEDLGWKWNEVQSTPNHIAKLADHLIHLDRMLARPQR